MSASNIDIGVVRLYILDSNGDSEEVRDVITRYEFKAPDYIPLITQAASYVRVSRDTQHDIHKFFSVWDHVYKDRNWIKRVKQ